LSSEKTGDFVGLYVFPATAWNPLKFLLVACRTADGLTQR
jgi:hypothetical protein